MKAVPVDGLVKSQILMGK